MEKVVEFLSSLWFYLSLFALYIFEGIKYLWVQLCVFIESTIVPVMPGVLKIFSNRDANMIICIIFIGYFLMMNIYTFALFGKDKHKARRQKNRISEKKLFRFSLFGGAVGGFIGMLCFNHKKRKFWFSAFMVVLFVLQVILESFIIGFLTFWGFFY